MYLKSNKGIIKRMIKLHSIDISVKTKKKQNSKTDDDTIF